MQTELQAPPCAGCSCALFLLGFRPFQEELLWSWPDLEQSVVPVECCAFSLYILWSCGLLASGSFSSLLKVLLNPALWRLSWPWFLFTSGPWHGLALLPLLVILFFEPFSLTVHFDAFDMIMPKVHSVCSFFQGSSYLLAKITPWLPFLFLSILFVHFQLSSSPSSQLYSPSLSDVVWNSPVWLLSLLVPEESLECLLFCSLTCRGLELQMCPPHLAVFLYTKLHACL